MGGYERAVAAAREALGEAAPVVALAGAVVPRAGFHRGPREADP